MTKNEFIEKHGIEAYERILEHNRNNYRKRKDVWRSTRHDYYENHKDYFETFNKEYHSSIEGRAQHLLHSYKQRDINNNLGECTLTFEWLMENIFSGQKCFYCGEQDPLKLGCDRIDNEKPHTPDNVVPCCRHCNLSRHTKTQDQFLNKISQQNISDNMSKNFSR